LPSAVIVDYHRRKNITLWGKISPEIKVLFSGFGNGRLERVILLRGCYSDAEFKIWTIAKVLKNIYCTSANEIK